MRGKVRLLYLVQHTFGITPAYAGKSWRVNHDSGIWTDHPRLCGEKFFRVLFAVQAVGSPPPMRGKVAAPVAEGVKRGITPAYAGKRYWYRHQKFRRRDHPRLCGEKSL